MNPATIASFQFLTSLFHVVTSRTKLCGEFLRRFSVCDVNLDPRRVSYQLEDLASVRCQKVVEKKLPRCEHSKKVACYTDPASVACTEPCGRLMECCSKECRGRCGECQKKNLDVNEARSGLIARINHATHPCERALYCQHLCGSPCHSKDQGCNNECKKPCRQRCVHYECQKHCSAPCTPCLKACPWKCVHHECPVACGSVRQLYNQSDTSLLNRIFRFVPDSHATNRVPRCLNVLIPAHLVRSLICLSEMLLISGKSVVNLVAFRNVSFV